MQQNIEKSESQINYLTEDRLATQKDLRILGLELEQKILQIKIELEQKINAIESSLFKKLGGLIIGCSGTLFALLAYLHKP